MPKRRKRRYPGAVRRAAATTLGLIVGTCIIGISSTKPIDKADLPLYARKIVESDPDLTKEEIAFVYAFSQYETPIDLSTPKLVSFRSAFGIERIEVSGDPYSGSPWSIMDTSAPIETVVFAERTRARYFDHLRGSDVKNQRATVDTTLNRALIAAYVNRLGKQDLDGEYEVSAWKSSDYYFVHFEKAQTVRVSGIADADCILDKHFVPMGDMRGGLSIEHPDIIAGVRF